MRPVLLCSALLFAGCAPYTRVIGPYRASLSPTDVHSVVKLAQEDRPGRYSLIIFNAVSPNKICVETYAGSPYPESIFAANRRGDTWMIGNVTGECAAALRISGTRTFGRTQDISGPDIEAAVAAYEASIFHGPAKYGDIEVVSHDEIRIYQDHAPCNYTSMVRDKGKWVTGSVVLVHRRY